MDAEPNQQEIREGSSEPGSSASQEIEQNGAPTAGDAPLIERVYETLKSVDDPELGINIVDLGLVYDVSVEDGAVHITYTLTTMGCPIGPMIEAQMKQFLDGVDGVDDVKAEMVLTPPWTPEKMSEEAKAALGMF